MLFFFGIFLIFMKSVHFQRANKPTKNSHWGVAWSSYHGTFYPCSAFWAPLIKEICLFWKFLWNATIFQDRTVVGDWRVAEAVSWDFGGSRATIWGESLGLGPTQEVGWGGDVFKPKTKIVNTKAKSKNKSHHLGARLGLCSGQEEVGEGVQPKRMNPRPRTSGPARDQKAMSPARPRPWETILGSSCWSY